MTIDPLHGLRTSLDDHHRLFFVVLVAMAGALLVWQSWTRTENFRLHHQQLARASAVGAAHELEALLHELQRSLRLFVQDREDLVRRIAAGDNAEGNWERLGQSVARYFPERFGFTLADAAGNVLLPDFDNLVDESCRRDIQAFAERGFEQRIHIHPNPLGFHFDVMVPWLDVGRERGAFFVSFSVTALARILEHAGIPRHSLLLVRNDRPGLIEVTTEGSREVLAGNVFLTQEQLDRVAYSVPVHGTRWDVVDLPDPDLYRIEVMRNGLQAAAVFLVFCAAGMLMLHYVRGREERRARAERALRDSEGRYRMLVETMNDGLAMQDEAGMLTYVNDRFCEMVGHSRAELLGRPAIEFIGEFDPSQWAESMQSRGSRNIESYEWDLQRKNGSVVHLSISPQIMVNSEGAYSGSFVVVADLSARKRIEDSLRKLSQGIEQSPNAVIITDREGAIEYVNPAFTEAAGYAANEAIGETLRILLMSLRQRIGADDQALRLTNCEPSVGRRLRNAGFSPASDSI